MSWREYKTKTPQEGIKVIKVFMPPMPTPFHTLNTLIPALGELKSTSIIEEDLPPFTDAELEPTPPPSCYCCKGQDFWQSKHGVTVCRRCHPPAPGAEIVTEPSLYKFFNGRMAEIAALRSDWTGFRKSQRQRLAEIETMIDDTFAALDRDGLTLAMDDYFEIHQPRSP